MTKRLSVTVPDELHARVRAAKLNVSATCRRALEEELARRQAAREARDDVQPRRRRAKWWRK